MLTPQRLNASTPQRLASGQSGRDFYADLYSEDLLREAEWLRRTAGQKVESMARLLGRQQVHPAKILEVGAGTGAVIGELRDRGIGTEHFAVDFSEDAIGFLREREPDVQAVVADITEAPDPFGEGPYDVVVASHVIEHLEAPAGFLDALHQVPARWFIAEVPLEDLAFGRLKALVSDRANHPAGHVQFYSKQTFLDELAAAGWSVADSRVYAPRLDADTFAFSYGNSSLARKAHKALTERILPVALGPLWTRVYHAHCTTICRVQS
ncbi:MAG: hypothetical protein Rubg2KO_04400 [Rubricoccaceae bacterium]